MSIFFHSFAFRAQPSHPSNTVETDTFKYTNIYFDYDISFLTLFSAPRTSSYLMTCFSHHSSIHCQVHSQVSEILHLLQVLSTDPSCLNSLMHPISIVLFTFTFSTFSFHKHSSKCCSQHLEFLWCVCHQSHIICILFHFSYSFPSQKPIIL